MTYVDAVQTCLDAPWICGVLGGLVFAAQQGASNAAERRRQRVLAPKGVGQNENRVDGAFSPFRVLYTVLAALALGVFALVLSHLSNPEVARLVLGFALGAIYVPALTLALRGVGHLTILGRMEQSSIPGSKWLGPGVVYHHLEMAGLLGLGVVLTPSAWLVGATTGHAVLALEAWLRGR
jgi:hypothetical protein